MKYYSIQEYLNAGCLFFRGGKEQFPTEETLQITDSLGVVCHIETKCRLCLTGCPDFKNGKCKAYQTLTSEAVVPPTAKVHVETVRQEAARLNISLSEARRRRNNITT